MQIDISNIKLFSVFIVFFICVHSPIKAQSIDTLAVTLASIDTIPTNQISENQILGNDSSLSLFKNDKDPFGKKILRGSKLALGFGVMMGGILEILPEKISKWGKNDKWNWSSMKKNFVNAYTLPPVIDHDYWFINYIGHPYQGGFYYNNVRSQGASFLTSSVYCLGQSFAWEYVLESSFERPSIQDLITTPIGGVIVGELSHQATLKMSKNGFNTLEKIIVCIINPSYAINNGLKTRKVLKF